jgi:hypothetical protein
MRITKMDLEAKEKMVNFCLRNVNVKASERYGYTAIDIVDRKNPYGVRTLISGLTKRDAYYFLDAMENLLRAEGYC